MAAGSATPRAATMPGVMLAPSEFETTGRSVWRAAPSSRVVVVLPLVALTITTSRWAVSWRSRSWSTSRAARPPMTLPDPKFTSLEAPETARPVATARRARGGRPVVGEG